MSSVNCSFSYVSERDMDMMFLQLFLSDSDFLKMFLEEARINGDKVRVNGVELSKTDAQLGESDITVYVEIDNTKYELLIEDKIDAVAMPEQASRYQRRGEKAVDAGECEKYAIFIICPQKYYENNDEAIKYPHMVSYETIRDFVGKKESPLYHSFYQLINQALDKAKKPSEVVLNEQANAFYCCYKDYQEDNYPMLDLRTTRKSNGYWAYYATALDNVYLDHKLREGRLDLTFNKGADKIAELQQIAEWLRCHDMNSVRAKVISKSGSLQIAVPKLDISKPFDEVDQEDLRMCFEGITELVRFVEMVSLVNKTIGKK